MKKRVLTFVTGLALTGFVATAQETAEAPAAEAPAMEEKSSGLEISGSIDTYYRTDISGQRQTTNTAFANGNQFAIGMANIVLAKEGKKVGFVADLVFGPRGSEATFGSLLYDIDGDGNNDVGNSAQTVNQLYAYWKASDKVTLTLGNFNTFLGYEVISPTGNFNYSTSYLFSYGPFSHTGLKADIAVTDKFSVMVGLMNQTDQTESNPINNLHAGLQLGYTLDNGGVWLNFIGGNPAGADGIGASEFEVDLTTGFDITEQLYLGLNVAYYNVGRDINVDGVDNPVASFFGTALYAQYAFSDVFALGFRGEYFSEASNATANAAGLPGVGAIGVYDFTKEDPTGSVIDLTLSGNIFLGDLTIIPEIRIDMVTEGKDAAGNPVNAYVNGKREGTNNLTSFAVAAVYAF